MERHKLLRRQIRKFLKNIDWEKDPVFSSFIEKVNDSYLFFEKNKKFLDHVFEAADKEYQEINEKLRIEKKVNEESINNLMKIIRASDELPYTEGENDLVQISLYLERLSKKQEESRLQLKKAIKKAKKAVRVKADFLSVMSHEIRSPLSIITGIIHVLLQEKHLQSQEENLQILKFTSGSLVSLINDILDYSKIEAGKIELEEKAFDLCHLIRNITRAHQLKAEENGSQLEFSFPFNQAIYLYGDSTRLGQVITNLVSNAVKFTKNGTINLSLNDIKQDKESTQLQISVKDSGIGIPTDKQQLIFEAFSQANSSVTREFGGTGLGLSISQKLLELMGSKLQLESKLDEGSTFYFDLKLPTAPSFKARNANNIHALNLNQAAILVVDDVKYNRMLIEKLLVNKNTRLDTAKNGKEAIDKVTNNEYDLILMDIHMPIMDGIEATKYIRKMKIDTPIVALTASDSSIRKNILDAGMIDFIPKPFSPDDFFEKIQKHILI